MFDSLSPIVALLEIWFPLFKSCTFTLNSIVFVSPAFKDTTIPLEISPCVSILFTFKLLSTYVVPVGIGSFTVTVSGAVPLLLSNFIVYVICWSFITSSPDGGFEALLICTSGLFTVVVTLFVLLLSTVAWFVIVFVNSFCAKLFTLTSKLKLTCPFAGTFTVIPFVKSVCVEDVWPDMLPSINVVPSGIVSWILTFFDKPPSFLTVIVYFILSPSNA